METDIEIRIVNRENNIPCKKFYCIEDDRLIGNMFRYWKDKTLYLFGIQMAGTQNKEDSPKCYIFKSSDRRCFPKKDDRGNVITAIQTYKNGKLYGKSIGQFRGYF